MKATNSIQEHLDSGSSLLATLIGFIGQWPEHSQVVECPPQLRPTRDELIQAAHRWFQIADSHFKGLFTYEDNHRLLVLYFNRLRDSLMRSAVRASYCTALTDSFDSAMQLLRKEPLGFPIAAPTLLPTEFEPNTAFILMWMDRARSELVDVSETFKEIFKKFGIVAVRADDIEQSDKITDLILDRIRSSEFLIADLTGERPNVYYEVGFAHAIGKRPILYRRAGTALHFDLSVHNAPEYTNITELRVMLKKRLEAMTGRIAHNG